MSVIQTRIFWGEMSKKLIIWDFDGVIADTEKMWLQNRMVQLNEKFALNWDLEKTNRLLGGMSDKTKRLELQKLGINTDDVFWKEAADIDFKVLSKGFALTPGIEDIFKISNFEQCIATGGTRSKTEQKIDIVGIKKYFPMNKVFTADMVKYGKPEPDLFLLAAKTMGFDVKDCIVVEDSIAGLTAALRAKITPIAFIGSDLYDKKTYKNKINDMGVNLVFDNMNDVKKAILSLT